jgi:hypothetical protein
VTAVVAFVVVVTWAAVAVRLRARGAQLERALEAAGDTTAPTPDADAVLQRGRFLFPVGLTVLGLGVLTGATAGLWGTADDERGSWVMAIYLAGLAVTALASAWLGRHRAGALRRAPAPVLRVLVRDDAQGTTEVYAADDLAAVRPLFTVDLTSYDDSEEPDDDEEDVDGEAGDEELERLLDAVDDDTPGPVREAVLYGAPFDGAELVVVSADEDPDQPPLTEWSTGPVRPLSPSAGMRRVAKEKAREEQNRQLEEQARELVVDRPPVPVRRWRAGWLDWLAAALLVLWGAWFVAMWFSESGAPLWKLSRSARSGTTWPRRTRTSTASRTTASTRSSPTRAPSTIASAGTPTTR